jgi:cyanate lyase
MKKQSLKQFIWQEMEKKGYVSDSEVCKFLGKEPNFCTKAIYAQEYEALNYAKNYFKKYEEDKNTYIQSYKPNHKGAKTRFTLFNDKLIGEGRGYKIIKAYYEYLKEKEIKEKK